jgi:hypothetical protein
MSRDENYQLNFLPLAFPLATRSRCVNLQISAKTKNQHFYVKICLTRSIAGELTVERMFSLGAACAWLAFNWNLSTIVYCLAGEVPILQINALVFLSARYISFAVCHCLPLCLWLSGSQPVPPVSYPLLCLYRGGSSVRAYSAV